MSTRAAHRLPALVVALVAASLALAGCTATSGPSATPTASRSESAYSIRVGDCVDDRHAAGELSTVPVVPCSTAHDSEAYKSITMPGTAFPGNRAIQAAAVKGCEAAFAVFTGVAYDDTTRLDFSWYHPTKASWAKGDRKILCLVESLNADRQPVTTVGSLRHPET